MVGPGQQKRRGILMDSGGINEVRILVRLSKKCEIWFGMDGNGELVERRLLLDLQGWSEWAQVLGLDSSLDLREAWKAKKVEKDSVREEIQCSSDSGWIDDVLVDYEPDEAGTEHLDLEDERNSYEVGSDANGGDTSENSVIYDDYLDNEVDNQMESMSCYDHHSLVDELGNVIHPEFSDGEEDIDKEFCSLRLPDKEFCNLDSCQFEYSEWSRSVVQSKRGRKPIRYLSRNGFKRAEEFCRGAVTTDPNLYPGIDQLDNQCDVLDSEGVTSDEVDEEIIPTQSMTIEHRREIVTAIITTIQSMTKSGHTDKDLDNNLVELIEALCWKAYEWGDAVFDESHARVWADGFKFTEKQLADDQKCLLDAGNDFDKMIRTRLALLRPDRLNSDRVKTHVSSDCLDLSLIEDLADDNGGMNLFLPPEYVPNSVTGLPPLSKSYLDTHEAVDKMISDNFRDKGLAMVFRLEEIVKVLPEFSVAVAKWTGKKDNEAGRNIHDASFRQFLAWCLNNEFSQQACKDHCGEINYPTVQDIIAMIWEFWEREKKLNPNVKWEDLRLWKMDLKGAFTLLNFKAECVKHVALLLQDGLIVFFLCGVFGWTGTPGYFQILSRVLMFELEKVFMGLARMFCDDIMGVCWKQDVEHELNAVRMKVLGLVGPNSVAEKKTEVGTALVELGYMVDLGKMAVSISQRNLLNALFGFMEIREHELVTFVMIERLASWGSRYSLVCVHMAPMVRLLYAELEGKPRWRKWKLSKNAKIAIWFFRAFLVLTDVIEGYYCRPLWSLRPLRAWYWICEFDACPQGLGCVWYQVQPSGEELPIGAASWSISSLGFGEDSSFQNTAEFMAAVMSVIGLVRYGGAAEPTLMRGDSKSALSWAEKKRYRGNLAVPAGFLFNYIWIRYKVLLCKCIHLPGELNVACDDLSRIFLENVLGFKARAKLDVTLPETERKYRHNFSAVGDRSACLHFEEFKAICDPRQVWESESDFGEFWGRMTRWCTQVLGDPPEEKSYFPEEWNRKDEEELESEDEF